MHVRGHLQHMRVRLRGALAVLRFELLQAPLELGYLPLQKKYPGSRDGERSALPQKKIV